MSLSLEEATVEGFLKTWGASAEIGDAVPGGIHDHLAKQNPDWRPATPYATYECKLAGSRKQEWDTGGNLLAYWDITVSLWGIEKGRLGLTIGTVRAWMDHKNFLIANAYTLRVEPLQEHTKKAGEVVDGEEIWEATLAWIVWTQTPRAAA